MSEKLDLRPIDINWRDKFDDKQYAIAFTEEVLASHRSLHAEAEDLSRKLEEARHRIAELETSLSAQTRITDAGHRSQKEMLERIASLEAALKLIKDFPITHPQENQDAANMAEIARSTLEGKDNA